MSFLPLAPEQASNFAAQIDWLYAFLIVLTGGVSVLIAVLLITFAIRYRRRPGREHAVQVTGGTKLEIAWTVVPLVLFVIPFAWGASVYLDMAQPPADALEVSVMAKQWMWKTQHPDGQREIDTLHVPVGRPVKLTMISQDVIHSFFVPAFRLKFDVLPGRYTTAWFTATKAGTFDLYCAEYCGLHHSVMRGRVVALPPAEFQGWLGGARGQASLSPASEGAKLFATLGCSACHRDDSLRAAPVLDGLYGRTVRLVTGETVQADETYLRESILNPAAKIVFGYQPIMPPFEGRITEEQVLQLIAYIRSLESDRGRTASSPR